MDWTRLRMFPPLRMAWGRRGEQIVVPIIGHNARRALFGTIDVRAGHRVVVRRRGTAQADFQAFLRDLRRRYRGRPVWLPKQASELNGMDQLWRELKRETSANRQYDDIEQHADQAERWALTLTPTEALRKAGILSANSWLRHFRKDFWRPTLERISSRWTRGSGATALYSGPWHPIPSSTDSKSALVARQPSTAG